MSMLTKPRTRQSEPKDKQGTIERHISYLQSGTTCVMVKFFGDAKFYDGFFVPGLSGTDRVLLGLKAGDRIEYTLLDGKDTIRSVKVVHFGD